MSKPLPVYDHRQQLVECPVSRTVLSGASCLACAAEERGQIHHSTGLRTMCKFDWPYIKFTLEKEAGSGREGVEWSASSFTDCLRAKYWDRTRTQAIDLDKKMAAAKGTAWHAQLEQYDEPNGWREIRLWYRLPSGRTFSGQFDRLKLTPEWARTAPKNPGDTRREAWIRDYKTKSERGKFKVYSPTYYILQQNTYRLILERGGATNIMTGEIFEPLRITKMQLLQSAHDFQAERLDVPFLPLDALETYLEECMDLIDQATPGQPPPPHTEPRSTNFCKTWCDHFAACCLVGGAVYDPKGRILELIGKGEPS